MQEDQIEKLNAYRESKGWSPTKLATMLTAMYNKMDGRCRQLALSNPSRPMADYCPRCQDLFREVFR